MNQRELARLHCPTLLNKLEKYEKDEENKIKFLEPEEIDEVLRTRRNIAISVFSDLFGGMLDAS